MAGKDNEKQVLIRGNDDARYQDPERPFFVFEDLSGIRRLSADAWERRRQS